MAGTDRGKTLGMCPGRLTRFLWPRREPPRVPARSRFLALHVLVSAVVLVEGLLERAAGDPSAAVLLIGAAVGLALGALAVVRPSVVPDDPLPRPVVAAYAFLLVVLVAGLAVRLA